MGGWNLLLEGKLFQWTGIGMSMSCAACEILEQRLPWRGRDGIRRSVMSVWHEYDTTVSMSASMRIQYERQIRMRTNTSEYENRRSDIR